MEQSRLSLKRIALMCILPFVLFLIMRTLKFNNEADAKVIIRIFLYALIAYGLYLAHRGRLNSSRLAMLILIAGIVLRFGYTLYTPALIRAHDMGEISEAGTGHYGYLFNLVSGHLPKSNDYQFYHPPLFYIISAVFVRLTMMLSRGKGLVDTLYMAQLVSCLASCLTLIFTKKILEELNASGRVQVTAVAVTAFYPAQIYAAGRRNNDALVFMFMVLALYYTLRWYKSTNIKDIIGIAVSIGLGMMTKINAGVIALITGPIMIYHFIKCIRSRDSEKIKSIVIQLFVFAVICFPLGLWYPIRNYIKFNQPLAFVPEAGKDTVFYLGKDSFFDRWINIPFTKFMQAPYMDMGLDKNVSMSIIKTGVHGEFIWEGLAGILAWGLEYVHTALILLAAVAIAVVMLCDRDRSAIQKFSVFCVWVVMTVSYISFNISLPYMCTADFRYILLGQAAAAVFIAYFLEFCRKGEHFMMYVLSTGVVFLFCAMSIIHIC